ncbi:holo-ACP synthase [Streptococcus himalayensis]|nr:holo-ACP synthase [Streptococcus himalayensis]
MIRGHGIDIEEISSIQKAYERNVRFVDKVLTNREKERFSQLSGKRKFEYLAGRWAAKEAFSKAWGTGLVTRQLSFQDLEILNNQMGAPIFTQSPFEGTIWVSISHAGNLVTASVILEEKDEKKSTQTNEGGN